MRAHRSPTTPHRHCAALPPVPPQLVRMVRFARSARWLRGAKSLRACRFVSRLGNRWRRAAQPSRYVCSPAHRRCRAVRSQMRASSCQGTCSHHFDGRWRRGGVRLYIPCWCPRCAPSRETIKYALRAALAPLEDSITWAGRPGSDVSTKVRARPDTWRSCKTARGARVQTAQTACTCGERISR